MTTFAALRSILSNANALVIVDDGTERWTGNRQQVSAWLASHAGKPKYGKIKLSLNAYQDLCDSTQAMDRDFPADPYRVRDALVRHGADVLYVL